MRLVLNNALEPGFVAIEWDGSWEICEIEIGKDAPFIGASVEKILPNQNLKKLDEIIVVNGPGSSTGLRIVCSYANGLQLISDCQMYIASSFDFVSIFNPEHPQKIVFPQPGGRLIVAENSDQWIVAEYSEITSEITQYQASQLIVNSDTISKLVECAKPVEVAIPEYWAPPQITMPKK